MGRTVESEILRRRGFGKGGDKERCGEVEAERSGDAGGEELGPEVGENVQNNPHSEHFMCIFNR